MRILHINKFLYPFGGAETYMFELAKAQDSIGHEIAYWGMSDDKNIVEDTYNSFAPNVNYHIPKSGNKFKQVLETIYSNTNKKRLGILLDKFNPTIVHIHNFNFQLTPSILRAIKQRGVKIVYTAHDSQLVCPWHRLYNFQTNSQCTKCVNGSFLNCIKDKCFDGSFSKSSVGAMESIFYHSKNYYDKKIDLIISPSKFLASLIRKKIKAPITTIPNFVDWELKDSYEKKQPYILYFGRVSPEKGIIDTLQSIINHKIHLKIVGNGPDVENIPNSPFIKYLGVKYDDELKNIISKAKFVILPSKWYENCPMTVIESFACGTPVISSNHSGFKELINNGSNGYLVNFSKPESYKSISEWINNYDVELSVRAKKDYIRLYSKKNHVDKVMENYNNLLK